jgi:hypothetical protein
MLRDAAETADGSLSPTLRFGDASRTLPRLVALAGEVGFFFVEFEVLGLAADDVHGEPGVFFGFGGKESAGKVRKTEDRGPRTEDGQITFPLHFHFGDDAKRSRSILASGGLKRSISIPKILFHKKYSQYSSQGR